MGIRMTDTKRMPSFMLRMRAGSWPCMPSAAPSSTVSRIMALHSTGSAYVGSATVRSVNHRAPPCVKDGSCGR